LRGFCDALDTYEDIIGVGNGVLKIGQSPQLIKGYHEYKISRFTETEYVPFDMNNPHIRTLLQAFRDIFPEEDVFKFMLYHASTGLDCKSCAGLLLLLVGGGQNGKSFFAQMIHETLGDMYCATGKPGLLINTHERSNEANSAQMQLRGKRYFYFDEFNKCSVLDPARIKTICNPGVIFTKNNVISKIHVIQSVSVIMNLLLKLLTMVLGDAYIVTKIKCDSLAIQIQIIHLRRKRIKNLFTNTLKILYINKRCYPS
jgi:hypothetical protein